MWVNKTLFYTILDDNKEQSKELDARARQIAGLQTLVVERSSQKAKDDISIDWMRHRVNALEKQNAILLQKAAGISLPVPEIVPTRPGTMTDIPNFDSLPSFEDVGDTEAQRLGLRHDPLGFLAFNEDMKSQPRTE